MRLKADKRTSLTAPEGKLVCDAYGIPVPKEGWPNPRRGRKLAQAWVSGVMKIVSPDILHKTEAARRGRRQDAADAEKTYETILATRRSIRPTPDQASRFSRCWPAAPSHRRLHHDGSFGKLWPSASAACWSRC